MNNTQFVAVEFVETGSFGFLNVFFILRVTKTSDGYLRVTFKDLTQAIVFSEELLEMIESGFTQGDGCEYYDTSSEYEITLKDVSKGNERYINVFGMLYFYVYDSAPFGKCLVAKEFGRKEVMSKRDFKEFKSMVFNMLND